MIEQNIKIEKKEKQEYPPLPENIYQVELLDVNIVEKPKYKKPDEKENVLDFQFTLLNGVDKDGSALRGRNIWRNFVPTYLYIGKNGKNLLYQILEALLGRELTREEEATMDTSKLNSLIGKQCRIVVKNNKKDDNVYSNIETFLPAENQLQSLSDEEKENSQIKKKDDRPKSEEENVPVINPTTEEAPLPTEENLTQTSINEWK